MKTSKNKSIMLILAGCLLLGSQTVNAQTWQYGIKAGLSGAVQSHAGDLYNNEDIRTGISAVFFVRYQPKGQAGVQTGLDYCQLGFKGKQPEGSVAYSLNSRYDYLQLPLLVTYTLPAEGKIQCFGAAGLYGGVLVSSAVESQYMNEKIHIPEYYLEGPKPFSAGYQAGVGFSFPAAMHHLSLCVIYKGGLTKVFSYDPDIRNKQLTVTMGWPF
jgi:hypothetical protein